MSMTTLTLVSTPGPSADVTPLAPTTPRARWRRLRAAWMDRYHAARRLTEERTAPLAPTVRTELLRTLEESCEAAQYLVGYLENRVSRLEADMRAAVAIPEALTGGAARRRLLQSLGGAASAARDGALLTKSEGQLLDAYRRSGPELQAALRALATSGAHAAALAGVQQARERGQ